MNVNYCKRPRERDNVIPIQLVILEKGMWEESNRKDTDSTEYDDLLQRKKRHVQEMHKMILLLTDLMTTRFNFLMLYIPFWFCSCIMYILY